MALDFDMAVMYRGLTAELEAEERVARSRREEGIVIDAEMLSGRLGA